LALSDQIRKLERRIDLRVYGLYGLTKQQRAIVDEYFDIRGI
jgi:hypothetical protein